MKDIPKKIWLCLFEQADADFENFYDLDMDEIEWTDDPHDVFPYDIAFIHESEFDRVCSKNRNLQKLVTELTEKLRRHGITNRQMRRRKPIKLDSPELRVKLQAAIDKAETEAAPKGGTVDREVGGK